MAIVPSFYNQGDQEIYESGNKFIPQEQYRLGYTAPPSIANAPNTGITSSQAAAPYKWPPLMGGGGGGGDGGLHNVYGYDPNRTKTFSKQVWSKTGPTEGWTTQDVKGYWSPSGWKTAKGKNINHAGLEVPTLMGTLMDKWAGIKPGEKQVGDIKGTFTKDLTEEEEEINAAAIASNRRRNLMNKMRAQAYQPPINVGGGGQDIDPTDPTGDVITRGSFEGDHPDAPTKTPDQGGWHPGVGGGADSGSGSGYDHPGSAESRESSDPFAQGGRIGLRPGGIVDAGKQYYGMEDWEIQQINRYGVSYPEFLQNQFGKGLHDMDASEIALAVKAWDSWRSSQAEGGRIGYAYGTSDPEEPAEDIHEIMRGENIPYGEQVEGEGDILSMLVAKYIEAGFPPDQAEEMAMQELQQMSADSGQGEGIAGLV